MPKLYKAIDMLDGCVSAFLVLDSGKVNVTIFNYKDSEQIIRIMAVADELPLSEPSRFNDAIDPILIAEW